MISTTSSQSVDYEEAINDWDHTQRVVKQDYDLDMIEGWDGDYGEITTSTSTATPVLHDMTRGQMVEEPLLRFEAARCGASPQPSVGARAISWWAGATN
eukprot:SAG11_NODE_2321_length_3524_cov_3.939270_2_plen_99_part_00